eukprot:2292705-Pleurochrysis_carterae.AAC.1
MTHGSPNCYTRLLDSDETASEERRSWLASPISALRESAADLARKFTKPSRLETSIFAEKRPRSQQDSGPDLPEVTLDELDVLERCIW